jgi:hypothetical protein
MLWQAMIIHCFNADNSLLFKSGRVEFKKGENQELCQRLNTGNKK